MPLTRQMALALAVLCDRTFNITAAGDTLAILAILGPGQMCAIMQQLCHCRLSTYLLITSLHHTSLLSRYFITSSPGMQPRPVQSGEEGSIVDILLAQNKPNKRRHMGYGGFRACMGIFIWRSWVKCHFHLFLIGKLCTSCGVRSVDRENRWRRRGQWTELRHI